MTGSWLRRYRPAERPALRLVCFPHAGGSAQFYRPWALRLPPAVEVVAVQYPGRAERAREEFCPDLRTLAVAVARALDTELAGGTAPPLALFGHSLGAAVAFEVALARSRRGDPPAHLLVSGRPEPTWPGRRHLADDDTLWADACGLGGTPEELVDDPAVRAMALPPMRADYRLSETYVGDEGATVDCPVTAYGGRDDPEVDPASMQAWAARTTSSDFTLRVLPGDHFFLVPGREAVTADILRRLARLLPDQPWPSTP
ncbi:thioesterase II family protein [Qaidamihabitans albus]|uniref:thioesterase II family protein n=1 Tax=Qaidamihabitans albus TaxID=2795733 RepID=UPI0018F15043|nr:alpha/beta fold hydrolase [Qaidamihabitans albus]